MICGDCGLELTEQNLYSYSYSIKENQKVYYCMECARKDMMISEEEFDKEIQMCKDIGGETAVIKGETIVWE